MSSEYEAKLQHAQSCEEKITHIISRVASDPNEPPALFGENFATKAVHDWTEIAKCCGEAIDIYSKYGKKSEAQNLVKRILDLAQTSNEQTSNLALWLLLSLRYFPPREVDNQNSDSVEETNKKPRPPQRKTVDWLEKNIPGTLVQIKAGIQQAIGKKLLEHEMDSWLLRNAYEFLRDLSDDDQQRKAVDTDLCKIIDLAVHLCIIRGGLDRAAAWCDDAAQIAQNRIGDAELAAYYSQRAAELRFQAVRQETQNPQPGDIAADLTQVIQRTLQKQHQERFLSQPEAFLSEYTSVENKLAKLLTDVRLLFDQTAIQSRAATHSGQGLLGVLEQSDDHTQFVDAHGNPRGAFGTVDRFSVQYVEEVAQIIGFLFDSWRSSDDLKTDQILAVIQPGGRWPILEHGVTNHFQQDYVSAVHLLIPQFENVVLDCAGACGIDTKRVDKGIPGEMLLNHLIQPDNTKMQALLGADLFDLIYWYMLKSDGPFAYRHKVAHGWINIRECTVQLSAMTLWLTMLVIVRTLPKRKPANL